MENDASLALVRPTEPGEDGEERTHRVSKRGRVGEGRPTKRTPEVVATIAAAIATGLTDEEASLIAGINPDTMTEWRKDSEFSGAIKRATAQRLKLRALRDPFLVTTATGTRAERSSSRSAAITGLLGTGQQRLGHRHLGDLGRPRQHSATPVTVKPGFRGNLCNDSKSDILDPLFNWSIARRRRPNE